MPPSIDAMTIYELKDQNKEALINYIIYKFSIMNTFSPEFFRSYCMSQYNIYDIFKKIKKLTRNELESQNKISLIEHIVVIKIIIGIHWCRQYQCQCNGKAIEQWHNYHICTCCFRPICGKKCHQIG